MPPYCARPQGCSATYDKFLENFSKYRRLLFMSVPAHLFGGLESQLLRMLAER